MPKKKAKGKKGKKGKKGGKKSKKAESKVAIAEASSKVWEAKLDFLEQAKNEFRDNAKRLMLENDALQTQMVQTEKDTIDVITYLKRQDQEKDNQVDRLQVAIKQQKKEHRREQEDIIEDFSRQINELEEKLVLKTKEVDVLQNELKMVKEFRRKRAQMQRELDEIKEAMFNTNRDHKETLGRMEQKFFEEKMRLQQEANQKIAELAEKAHSEAIANLDDTTRSVYKENVRLSESLQYHMREGEMLKKIRARLEEENETLKGDKELNDAMVQEKVAQVKQQKTQIKQLTEKVSVLEKSLSHVVMEFDTERGDILARAKIENEAAQVELDKLQRVIELKSKEMNKVKRLARNILDQRTELERFFLESLEQVKREISANQAQYRHDAHLAYQQKMLAAHAGKAEFPKIRTFNKSETSTNSVYKDLEAAEKLYNEVGKVDVSELTWEQKERVLRYLFGRMNGSHKGLSSASPLPAIRRQDRQLSITMETSKESDLSGADSPKQTFLTQTGVDDPNLSLCGSAPLPGIPQGRTTWVEPQTAA
ncbi:basal body-orientation factor 1-like [Liolophura sinensis]|uniref:basal body-orientation factor 1-like n=1 Tax=Liolophura sinensis TaxID=3198878 RepID=UPI003159675F